MEHDDSKLHDAENPRGTMTTDEAANKASERVKPSAEDRPVLATDEAGHLHPTRPLSLKN